MKIKVSNVNTPNWKEVTVKSRVPAELEKLSELARNIWWAWNCKLLNSSETWIRLSGKKPVRILCFCLNV